MCAACAEGPLPSCPSTARHAIDDGDIRVICRHRALSFFFLPLPGAATPRGLASVSDSLPPPPALGSPREQM